MPVPWAVSGEVAFQKVNLRGHRLGLRYSMAFKVHNPRTLQPIFQLILQLMFSIFWPLKLLGNTTIALGPYFSTPRIIQ
jgi:hypothetical protein